MDKYTLEETIKAHLKRAGLSQAAAARKLHYTPEQFNKWVRSVNRIPDVAIQKLSDLLGLSDEERTELFTLADYVAITALTSDADPADTAGGSIVQSDTAAGSNRSVVSVRFDSAFFIDALRDWGNHFFRWSEASEHNRSSWTGMVIHSLSAVVDRMTPRGLLIFCLSGLLGIITVQLVAAVFQWPLDEVETRQMAYLKYGLATLLIPLLVAFVTPPDQANLFQLETAKQKITFWVLKFTGALVGFWVFSMSFIGLALVLYYLHAPPLAAGFRAIFALVPLFLSYVVARRIPIDRYKMFNGQLQTHPADRLFLVVFMVAGPLSAFFLRTFYWFLSDRSIAPIILLIVLTGIAVWEYRKQNRRSISDPISILVLGLLFPAIVLLYAFFLTPDFPPLSLDELPQIVIISIYFLSWTLLAATLFIRKQPILTLPGVLSLLGLLIIANLIAINYRWLGGGFIFAISLIWAGWGQKRFRPYFWVHSSVWAMIVTTGASLYLLVSNAIPLWANSLGFLTSSIILLGWAYRIPDKRH